MHFRYTSGPPTAGDIQTFANDVLSKVGSRIMIQLPSDTSCLAVFAEDLDSATGATALSTSAAIPGTTGASARSAADSVLVAPKMARRYRGGKPRIYFPPMEVGAYHDERTWDSTRIATFGVGFTNLINDVIALSYSSFSLDAYVNVSYYSGHHLVTYPSGWSHERPTPRGSPVIDVLLTAAIELVVATIRRRLQRSS
jgi:hypothetical protein